jgi:hypothetical protein
MGARGPGWIHSTTRRASGARHRPLRRAQHKRSAACLPEVVAGRVNLIGVYVLGQVSALLLAKEVRRVLAGFFARVRKAMEDTFFVRQ